MGKIWEALQHAQAERARQEAGGHRMHGQLAEDLREVGLWAVSPLTGDQTGEADRTPCECDLYRRRVHRQGIQDFLCRLAGWYP
ncbi:hypothetical protein, partial [Salmonella enterica]|uniref:hypothetical protein n=1 Tax=Salmonella enterica TaxID=28901 RepID=UPI003FA72F16